MMETPDLLHQLPAIILAGACTYIWLVARDRRKAVDRLVETIDRYDGPFLIPELKNQVRRAGLVLDDPEYQDDEQDAAGRVIARSVERLTKEKR